MDHIRAIPAQILEPRTYRKLSFMALGGLWGFLYLAIPSALSLAGVDPTPTLLLVPLIIVLSAFSRKLRDWERRLTNVLLRTDVEAPEQEPGTGSRGPRSLDKIVTDPVAWSAAGWLSLRALFGLIFLVLIAGAFALLIVPALSLTGEPPGTAWMLLLAPAGLVLLFGAVHFAVVFAGFYRDLAEELLGPSAAEKLALLQRRLDLSAERNRLAGELHDSIGHTITFFVTRSSAAIATYDSTPEDAYKALLQIRAVGRASLEEMDRVINTLWNGPSGFAERHPARAELETLFELMRKAKATLSSFVFDGFDDLPEHLQREACRVVREGCTNVLRHTDFAPTDVTVESNERNLKIAVVNEPSGSGFRPRAAVTRRGLRGIAERAKSLGGYSAAGPTETGGYRLLVSLPLKETGE